MRASPLLYAALASLHRADVADSHCIAWTPVTRSDCVSRSVQEQLSQLHLGRQVLELLSVFASAHQTVFASDLLLKSAAPGFENDKAKKICAGRESRCN